MTFDELLTMIQSDQEVIQMLVTNPSEYEASLEGKVDAILNNQHTILLALSKLLIVAQKEGKTT